MSHRAWAIVAVLVAVLAGLAFLIPHGSTTPQQATPTTNSVSSSTVPPTASAAPGITSQAWYPVAVGFATDYATPGTDQANWVARMAQWCSPTLLNGFRSTDLRNLDTGTGPQLTTTAATPTYTDVHVAYSNGGAIVFRLEQAPGGWRVTAVDRAADDTAHR